MKQKHEQLKVELLTIRIHGKICEARENACKKLFLALKSWMQFDIQCLPRCNLKEKWRPLYHSMKNQKSFPITFHSIFQSHRISFSFIRPKLAFNSSLLHPNDVLFISRKLSACGSPSASMFPQVFIPKTARDASASAATSNALRKQTPP